MIRGPRRIARSGGVWRLVKSEFAVTTVIRSEKISDRSPRRAKGAQSRRWRRVPVPNTVRAASIFDAEGGSVRGVNPYQLSFFECTSKQNPGFSPVFPTLQAVQGLFTSRGDEFSARGGRRQCAAISTVRYTVRRGCSSAGRAPALQAGGRRFESAHLHQHIDNRIGLSRSPECRKAKLDPLSNLT